MSGWARGDRKWGKNFWEISVFTLQKDMCVYEISFGNKYVISQVILAVYMMFLILFVYPLPLNSISVLLLISYYFCDSP
jgi:hypothetical protein